MKFYATMFLATLIGFAYMMGALAIVSNFGIIGFVIYWLAGIAACFIQANYYSKHPVKVES